jgi:hypothetical protein
MKQKIKIMITNKEVTHLIKQEIYLQHFIQNLLDRFKRTIETNKKLTQIKKRINPHLRKQVII